MYTEFKPFNRYILVRPVENKSENQPAVLVPDDYRIEPKHKIVEVVRTADSCNIELYPGENVVVEASMVEELALNSGKHYLVLENYVLATLGVPKNET